MRCRSTSRTLPLRRPDRHRFGRRDSGPRAHPPVEGGVLGRLPEGGGVARRLHEHGHWSGRRAGHSHPDGRGLRGHRHRQHHAAPRAVHGDERPRAGDGVLRAGGGETPDVPAANLAFVRDALNGVAKENSSVRKGLEDKGLDPSVVACKTGTGEVAGKDDFAWFACYAPVDDPRFVVAVLVEEGGGGSESATPLGAEVSEGRLRLRGRQPDRVRARGGVHGQVGGVPPQRRDHWTDGLAHDGASPDTFGGAGRRAQADPPAAHRHPPLGEPAVSAGRPVPGGLRASDRVLGRARRTRTTASPASCRAWPWGWC